jgi:hypothetical protein
MDTRPVPINNAFYELSKYGPKNVLHVGGHVGEEGELYERIGVDFTFVEPVPEYAEQIRKKGYKVLECAVGERGIRDFIVRSIFSSFWQRDSKYDNYLKNWLGKKGIKDSPEKIKVKVVPLSSIQKGFDTLVVDAEGSDLEVLKSGKLNFKTMIIEVRGEPAYVGGVGRSELESYIFSKGYTKAEEHANNVIYIKKNEK